MADAGGAALNTGSLFLSNLGVGGHVGLESEDLLSGVTVRRSMVKRNVQSSGTPANVSGFYPMQNKLLHKIASNVYFLICDVNRNCDRTLEDG